MAPEPSLHGPGCELLRGLWYQRPLRTHRPNCTQLLPHS